MVDPARGAIAIDGQEIQAAQGLEDAKAGEARAIALRPEIVSLHEAPGHGNRMQGTVEDVNFLGSIVRIRVRFGENAVSLDTFNNPTTVPPQPGQAVTVTLSPGGGPGPRGHRGPLRDARSARSRSARYGPSSTIRR